ncbi:MAG: hypothetical protein JWP63_5123 [Candidatus Solibacter sp.]|nr:hypothetical protein [Candidatus Solibacter sp.]
MVVEGVSGQGRVRAESGGYRGERENALVTGNRASALGHPRDNERDGRCQNQE